MEEKIMTAWGDENYCLMNFKILTKPVFINLKK